MCRLLNIEYPIIQAPMNWISGADLVAAVSKAGGMGTLGPNAGQKTPCNDEKEVAERLRGQINKVRSLTDKPFAVNIAVASGDAKKFSDAFVRTVIDENVPVAIVTMGGPQVYTRELKNAGVKVIQTISTVRHGKRAEAEGVDAVVAGGYESGGHLGIEDQTTLCLVPQVVDAVHIPVIAAGGITDARGLVAVLALGAQAAYMGTRFLATYESDAHPNVKEAVLKAKDSDLVVLCKNRGVGMSRVLKNDWSNKFYEKEIAGASLEELLALMESHVMTKPGYLVSRMYVTFCLGDVVQGSVSVSGAVGSISELMSAGDVVEQMMSQAKSLLKKLNK
ncbi:MAG: nitronate monooxygenase [Dehalococcoidia bacterium]|nr:nitronate monooxygenase [Dehalococcoidia bacterium]